MKTSTTETRTHAWRSRWAAIGAAVAVTLGAGGLMVADAASSAPSTFVSIDPTRVLDTRTDAGLPGPFASGQAQNLQVTGTVPTQPPVGPIQPRLVVPTTASSVVLNVTVVAPSAAGFLSIRPGDATGAPATSNINFGSGGPNIANAVTVALPTSGPNAGQINIYVSGTVKEVLIDVAGYYEPAGATGGSGGIVAASNKKDDIVDPTAGQFGVAMSVTVEATSVGIIQITGSAFSLANGSEPQFDCRITRGNGVTTNDSSDDLADTDRGTRVPAQGRGNCTTNGTVAVGAGTHVINLVVRKDQSDAEFDDGTLQALFIPGGILDNTDG